MRSRSLTYGFPSSQLVMIPGLFFKSLPNGPCLGYNYSFGQQFCRFLPFRQFCLLIFFVLSFAQRTFGLDKILLAFQPEIRTFSLSPFDY
jgi:hypothetical protein